MGVKFFFWFLATVTAIVCPLLAKDVPSWSRVGSTVIDLGLVGPVGGAVSDTAFSPDGAVLYVRTAVGQIWKSSNEGLNWSRFEFTGDAENPFRHSLLSDADVIPPADDPNASILQHSFRSSVYFALGHNLHRSVDGGNSWINLTGDDFGSIIGPWQSSITISPISSETLIVGNSFGVWKSVDNGLTWSGLNQNLPNLPTGKLMNPPASDRFLLYYANGFGALETNGHAGSIWRRAIQSATQLTQGNTFGLPESDLFRRSPILFGAPDGIVLSYRVWMNGIPITGDLTTCGLIDCEDPDFHYISAFASSADAQTLYLGTTDGLVWISENAGLGWRLQTEGLPSKGSVAALFVHPNYPRSSLVIFNDASRGRIFHTTNAGSLWSDLTGQLPDGKISSLTVDSSTGATYIAGEVGIFYTVLNLIEPAAISQWESLGRFPATAKDILLDTVAGRLYAVIEGYGVFAANAPNVSNIPRVLNAADLTERDVAPGGLLAIFGKALTGARIDGLLAPLLFSDDRGIQIQVPYEAEGHFVELELITRSGSHITRYPLAKIAPAIFVDGGNPLVFDAATGRLVDTAYPAVSGGRILILATGLGAVKPEWPTGVSAPRESPPEVLEKIQVYLDDIPLRVISATLAVGYIGTYVVDVEVPFLSTARRGDLFLEAANKRSNRVRIWVGP
tara:strand:+ start:117871 stop:119901 length:2031 start_codon:yes stop_codon:yes gene_type:complete